MERRAFVQIAAVMAPALPGWLAVPLMARAQTPVTRYDLNSDKTEAKNAVKKYREAVRLMRQRKPHDPTGWRWQANMHGWPGQFGGNPDTEFRTVFPTSIPGVSPQERTELLRIARETWGKCPHGPTQFLPWHRVYLYFFERLMQAAIGDSTLGVPYWNWTKNRELPLAFRQAIDGSQAKNALFYTPRNSRVSGNSAGLEPISLRDAEVDIRMLGDPVLDGRIAPANLRQGFGPAIEAQAHGNVHVFVGDDRGMGFFEYAARDPVFWSHHANIDRLWDSWATVPGHKNPKSDVGWLAQKHNFIDTDGSLVSLSTGEVLTASAILTGGYVYERLEDAPTPEEAGPAAAEASSGADSTRSIAKRGPVSLSNSRQDLRLNRVPPVPGVAPAALSGNVKLVFRDLRVEKAPGDNFLVFINLPPGEPAEPSNPHYVGTLNFFMAARPSGSHAAPAHQHTNEPPALNASETIRRLRERGLLTGDEISVTLVPARSNVKKDAKPSIGSIELIQSP